MRNFLFLYQEFKYINLLIFFSKPKSLEQCFLIGFSSSRCCFIIIIFILIFVFPC